MSAHIHAIRPGQPARPWTHWLVEFGVAALVCLGVYLLITNWREEDFAFGLVTMGLPLAAAFLYGFGYLWCVSDVIGGEAYDHSRSLHQRWSDFAMLSVFFALAVTLFAYIWAIWENLRDVEFGRVLPILFLCCWMMPASAVASEIYLEGRVAEHAGAGWRNRVRRALHTFGGALVMHLKPAPALLLGGAATLGTLNLALGDDIFSSTTGYDLLKSHALLPGGLSPGSLLAYAFRIAYVAGLLTAFLALVAALPVRMTQRLRASRFLLFATGALAVFQLAVAAEWPPAKYAALVVWAAAVVAWLWVRRAGADRERSRVAAMLFCLPVFLCGLAMEVVLTYFSLGNGMLVLGLLLIWWGLIQSQKEARGQRAAS